MGKKILVVGEYFSENLGDGVICETVRSLIEDSFPDTEVMIADIMGRTCFTLNEDNSETLAVKESKIWRETLKKYFSEKQGKGIGFFYDRLVYRKWLQIRKKDLEVIKQNCNNNYDLVVFAGGQLMYEPFVIPIIAHIKELEKRNIPVIFNGCGFGKFTNSYAIKQFNKYLDKDIVKSITVRDYVDEVNTLLLKNNRVQALKTNDPALWVEEAYKISKSDSDVIGLGIIKRSDPIFNLKQKQLYKNIIEQFETDNQKWELFCNGEVADQIFALEIVREIGLSENKVSKRPLVPTELVNLIASYKSIISFRLHSHIISTSLKIPGVGMSWDKKVNFYFNSFNADDRCFTVNTSSEEIVTKINEIDCSPINQEILKEQKIIAKNILIKSINELIN